MSATKTAPRIGAKQAVLMLQLDAGYVVCREGVYDKLRDRGLVTGRFDRSGKEWPTLTHEGRRALQRYVNENGRLEVEMKVPLADYTTVIRMDRKD